MAIYVNAYCKKCSVRAEPVEAPAGYLYLRAFIKSRQYKLPVPQRFGRREPTIRGAQHHVKQLVSRLIEHHVTL